MSKRNVAYVKPQDPTFLAQLKQQVQYKEGPTVDTKRQALDNLSDDSDGEDNPLIVVLKPGDLTAEEVERHKKEAQEAPAQLEKKVFFKKPQKRTQEEEPENPKKAKKEDRKKGKGEKGSKTHSGTLSFTLDDEEQE